MRTYGRVLVDPNGPPDGPKRWVQVDTTPEAGDDYVWLTTLVQVLKLNLGESPFYANFGIPAKPSVVQQVFPDFYVTRTQQQFAPKFGALIVSKLPGDTPNYKINVTLNNGVPLEHEVAT